MLFVEKNGGKEEMRGGRFSGYKLNITNRFTDEFH
jgi:hypothetical protein